VRHEAADPFVLVLATEACWVCREQCDRDGSWMVIRAAYKRFKEMICLPMIGGWNQTAGRCVLAP
jgi:hypothetical protein